MATLADHVFGYSHKTTAPARVSDAFSVASILVFHFTGTCADILLVEK